MRSPFRHTTYLLVAAAGILIATAPTASADPADCTTVDGTGTVCGNTSIDDSPRVQYPYPDSDDIGPPGTGDLDLPGRR